MTDKIGQNIEISRHFGVKTTKIQPSPFCRPLGQPSVRADTVMGLCGDQNDKTSRELLH